MHFALLTQSVDNRDRLSESIKLTEIKLTKTGIFITFFATKNKQMKRDHHHHQPRNINRCSIREQVFEKTTKLEQIIGRTKELDQQEQTELQSKRSDNGQCGQFDDHTTRQGTGERAEA